MRRADLAAARSFVATSARVLDRRRFARLFDGGAASAVVDALRAYANADGGFAYGLEPDTRGSASQPLDTQVALEVLADVGGDPGLVDGTCRFLEEVGPDGAVPILLPTVLDGPRADHWQDVERWEPDLNPTAAVAAALHRLGADHPWREAATAWCFGRLESAGPPAEAHGLRCVLAFLDHVPDQGRAEPLARAAGEALPTSAWFRSDPADREYGVPPWDFAPTPDSPWRSLFDDDAFEAHLDRLVADQQPDGGWPLTWQPPGEAATLEYRGVVAVHALRVLRAYDRL